MPKKTEQIQSASQFVIGFKYFVTIAISSIVLSCIFLVFEFFSYAFGYFFDHEIALFILNVVLLIYPLKYITDLFKRKVAGASALSSRTYFVIAAIVVPAVIVVAGGLILFLTLAVWCDSSCYN